MPSRLCLVALFVAALNAAPPVNVSGAWRVDVQKSVWGTRPKPVSVMLHIQHREPALAYSGVVIYSGEDARPFTFDGSLDGKPYHMDRSFGSGTVVLRRLDGLTFESVFRTSDGTSVETTRTTISVDGKSLKRQIRLESGGVTSTSTEIYYRN